MYDEQKVDFTPEEHDAAKTADEIYEKLHEMLENGIDLSDIAQVPGLITPSLKLYKWLMSADRAEFAGKLLALAVMLNRDNSWL